MQLLLLYQCVGVVDWLLENGKVEVTVYQGQLDAMCPTNGKLLNSLCSDI